MTGNEEGVKGGGGDTLQDGAVGGLKVRGADGCDEREHLLYQ